MPAAELAPSKTLTILEVCPEHCAASLGGVLLLIIKEDPRASIFEQQRRWLKRLKEDSPEGCVFLAVLQVDTPPPTEAARATIKRVFREFGPVMKAGVMLIEAEGFAAATFRSVLSMLVLTLRLPYSLKVFQSTQDACFWLLPHLGRAGRVSGSEVLMALKHLKSEYRAGTLQISGIPPSR